MPKRTNAFQDLIAAIHGQLVTTERVCESEMLLDRVTGQEREVDIVIHSALTGYDLILSVECTSSGRPASVEWVEQMCCKHSSLPTQKLVLVSKSGFTASALGKAAGLGLECHSLESARNVDWTKYVDRLSRVFISAIDLVTIVTPSSPTYTLKEQHAGIPMNTRFLDAGGESRATAEEVAYAVLVNRRIRAATVDKMTVDSAGGWEIILPMQSGVRMRLPNGEEHEVHEIKVAVLADPLIVCFDLERAAFRGSQLAYGSSSDGKGEFVLTILETQESGVNAQVRIRRPWGEVQTYSLTGNPEHGWCVASDDAMRALLRRATLQTQ